MNWVVPLSFNAQVPALSRCHSEHPDSFTVQCPTEHSNMTVMTAPIHVHSRVCRAACCAHTSHTYIPS